MDWTGKLPDNVLITDVQVIPAEVQVVGGKTLLEGIHTFYTTPLRVDSLTESGSITAPLIITPASLKLADPAQERVEVRFSVAKRSDKKGPEG